MSTPFDLTNLGLSNGTYDITAISKAGGYADSAESETVSYEVAEDELIGTWVFKSSVANPTTYDVVVYSKTSIDANWGTYKTSSDTRELGLNTGTVGSVFMGVRFENNTISFGLYNSTSAVSITRTYLRGNTLIINDKISSDGVIINDYFRTWLKANATKQ